MRPSAAARGTALVIALAGSACAAKAEDTSAVPFAESGGGTTVFDESRDAFSYSARNLGSEGRDTFLSGKSLFQRFWVRAPASTEGGDGLGPTYTATSCTACHIRLGRGAVPDVPRERALGLVARLERDDGTPDPSYGRVLQPFAIDTVTAEGKFVVAYETSSATLADGTKVSLRKPHVVTEELAFGPLAAGTTIDVRVAPQLVGLGLLEAVPEADILARIDADDSDGDGVRGAAQWVRSGDLGGREALGRFGWRARVATVRDFVADAFAEDIGITSALHSDENCPPAQTECRTSIHGGTPELTDAKLDNVAFFARTVAVPARRAIDDAEALRGERVFATLGCATCHVPKMTTGKSAIAALSEQTIAPYTDLLLHDMGEGLGDARRTKTRTPPLWGMGLHDTVNGHRTFLHDGRATDPVEAVMWHGGEGERARSAFASASSDDRRALVRFLESL